MRVLVLRALGLGDLLTGLPALRALHTRFGRTAVGGSADAVMLAAPAWLEPVARLSGAVDALIPVEAVPVGTGGTRGHVDAEVPTGTPGSVVFQSIVRARRPDLAVNLHGRGPQSTAALRAVDPDELWAFGEPGAPSWDPAEINEPRNADAGRDAEEHEVDRWCRLLAGYGVDCRRDALDLPVPVVPPPASGVTVVHPGGAAAARRWPARRWSAVAGALWAEGHDVVVTGNAGESELAHTVAHAAGLPATAVLAGRLDLPALCALVAHARLVLCADTGAGHLATAYRTPSVVLFGPVSPARWGPPAGRGQIALWAGRRGNPFAATPDPGLLALTTGQVLAAARSAPDTGNRAGVRCLDRCGGGHQHSMTVNPIQVQKFLQGIDYPVGRRQIIETARSHGADDNVIKTLERIPDRQYDGPNAVSTELGKH